MKGGFSLETDKRNWAIMEGIKEFSQRMTYKGHRFIMSGNAEDLRNIVNGTSSDIRVKLQPIEEAFMQFVQTGAKGSIPSDFTTQLKQRIEEKEHQEAAYKRPLAQLSNLAEEYFLEKSIEITSDLVIGTHPTRVKIGDLSAGEKNFPGFVVYAMSKPDAVFIDEPELGLHADWQRRLIGVLHDISPNTQCFIVTHASPIRAAYPDKQIFLEDRIEDYAA